MTWRIAWTTAFIPLFAAMCVNSVCHGRWSGLSFLVPLALMVSAARTAARIRDLRAEIDALDAKVGEPIDESRWMDRRWR